MSKNQIVGGLPLIPQVDVLEVIQTRVLNFEKEFRFGYCDEIVYALDKLMKYDEIMKTPTDRLYVRIVISSFGGYVYALTKVLEKIEVMKSKGYCVHTHVPNHAMSCGFILYCSGTYKTVSPFALLMNHQAWRGSQGTTKEIELSAEQAKKEEEMFSDYIRNNTNMSEEEIQRPYITNTDIYYTAEESVTIGLTDAIKMY